MKTKFILFLTLLLIFIVYLSFPLNTHTWESYYYSGCLDHFIDAEDMQPVKTLKIPYSKFLCIHYTQHPALYYTAYFLCHTFFSLKDGLIIVSYLNICLALLSYIVCYFLCFNITRSPILSCIMILFLSFSDIHWYQSLSGEVYVGPFLFIVIAAYYLFIPYVQSKSIEEYHTNTIYASVFLGLAIIFHMFACLFYFVFLYYLYEIKKQNPKFKVFRQLFICSGIIFLFYIFAYVLPYIVIVKINSFQSLLQVIFLHTNNWGIWHVPLKYVPFEIAYSFVVGTKHFLHAIISGIGLFESLLRFLIFACCMGALYFFFVNRQKNIIQKILLVWFSIYYLAIIVNVPMVNDYWIFNLFPLMLFLIIELQHHLNNKLLISIFTILSIVVFYVNFNNDIYIKSKTTSSEFFVLSKVKPVLKEYKHIVMMGRNLVLSEIFYLHQSNQTKTKFYYHRSDTMYPSKGSFLTAFKKRCDKIPGKYFLFIIDGQGKDKVRISHYLEELNMKEKLIFHVEKKYNPQMYKTAIGIIEKPFAIHLYGMVVTKSIK